MTTLVGRDFQYIAKSTDIVDTDGVLTLPKASVIGAKVYITDSSAWYIVDEDMVLKAYVQPALET